MTYETARDTLLKSEGFNFVGEVADRLEAAKALAPGGLDELLVIADYQWRVNHFGATDPCPEVSGVLQGIWEANIEQYKGLGPEEFLGKVAEHYLGRLPEATEVIPNPEYGKVVHAFQSFMLPGMAMGRVDSMVRAVPNTLGRILTGYNRIVGKRLHEQ